jgi:hypothetical protein
MNTTNKAGYSSKVSKDTVCPFITAFKFGRLKPGAGIPSFSIVDMCAMNFSP